LIGTILDEEAENKLQPVAPVRDQTLVSPIVTRIPRYRRDIFPKSILLSAEDLGALCRLIEDANERAKIIEFSCLDMTKFESSTQARDKVNELIRVEYNYVSPNGDSVQGLGVPKVDESTFPSDLRSFFTSNGTFTQRSIKVSPLNAADCFLSFEKPTLKLDFQTMPSNPTNNKSVFNVYGNNEDWVIATADRLQEFLRGKKCFRPAIHGSGTYDYLIYILCISQLSFVF
jgi:hypothetical protein